jgi:hypothetical protein
MERGEDVPTTSQQNLGSNSIRTVPLLYTQITGKTLGISVNCMVMVGVGVMYSMTDIESWWDVSVGVVGWRVSTYIK